MQPFSITNCSSNFSTFAGKSAKGEITNISQLFDLPAPHIKSSGYTMLNAPYFSPVSQISTEIHINKSRFISTIRKIESANEMEAFLKTIKNKHSKANHHCWGLIAGTPHETHLQGCNDDGEPSSTAGKPILKIMHHSNLGKTGLVVSRYFGGIKLGTGGLVRAYSEAAKNCIEIAELQINVLKVQVICILPYHLESTFRYVLQRFNVEDAAFSYSERIDVQILIDAAAYSSFAEELNNRVGVEIEIIKKS